MVAGGGGISIDDRRDHRGGDRGGVIGYVVASTAEQGVIACTAREAFSKVRAEESIIKRCAADALAIGRDGRIDVHIGNTVIEAVGIWSRIFDNRTDIERVAHQHANALYGLSVEGVGGVRIGGIEAVVGHAYTIGREGVGIDDNIL